MKIERKHSKKDHLFYSALTILISAIGFAGFSFTYFGPIIRASYPSSGMVLHVHGWSFFLWYLLFPIQAILIARKKSELHMILGRFSVVLVFLMTLTGIIVLTVRVEDAVRNGGSEFWLLYGPLILSNLVLFVIFYSAAMYMAIKNRLQSHKRLIIVASSIALGAGLFRLVLHLSGFHPMSLPVGVLGCSLFIIVGIIYDKITHRHVHPAYWAGLGVMLIVEVSLLPQVNGEMVAWLNEVLAPFGEYLRDFYPSEPTGKI